MIATACASVPRNPGYWNLPAMHVDSMSAELVPCDSSPPKKLRKIVARCGGNCHSAVAAVGGGPSANSSGGPITSP